MTVCSLLPRAIILGFKVALVFALPLDGLRLVTITVPEQVLMETRLPPRLYITLTTTSA